MVAASTSRLVEYNLDNEANALNKYIESRSLFKQINNKSGEANVLNNIGLLFNNQYRFKEAIKYLKESKQINQETNDTIGLIKTLGNIGFVYNNSFKIDSALVYLNEALKLARLKNTSQQAILFGEIGRNHVKRKEYKTAINYFSKSLTYSDLINDKKNKVSVLFDISTQYILQKKLDSSIIYSNKALNLAKEVGDQSYIKASFLNLYEAYKELGNTKKALQYLEESNNEDLMINEVLKNRNLQEFEIKQVRLKDSLTNVNNKLIREFNHQREKTKLITFWIISLLSVAFIAFIIYKNIKRKQLQAEQEKEIELQKKEKLLKDIELSTIDAMIEGQEKERQTIANDLHDDLGAVMTTLKLNINALKEKNSPELLETTNKLIDSAYNKIRGVAHVKNSGVIGKKGLLVAIQNMAEKITETNQLDIHVIDHGLEDRLENSLELTLFRIIQELITNIIKHAQASEVNIHLTNHKNSLNIMVEDNGIGFNVKKVKTGIGIKNIEKRINHLNGTLTIDSETNKGTTIIIDVPL